MSDFSQQLLPVHSGCTHTSAISSVLTRSVAVSLALGAAMLAGCGSNYRPTTTPIVGTGPAAQPGSYAFVISTPSASSNGVGTVIDYSGDTVMATAPIGVGPETFTLAGGGGQAWTLNADGTLSNIPVSTTLQAKNVTYSTLNSFTGTDPVVGLFAGTTGLYALDVNANNVDVLNGSPDAFKLVVPVDPTPVAMVGVNAASRYYAITQTIPYLTQVTLDGQQVDGGVACNIDPHAVGVSGVADGIETSPNYTVSSHIPVGVCPVYAIGTPDTRRVFVLNRGDDTISVINSQNNSIDQCAPGVNQNGQPYTCHPSLKVAPAAGLAHAGPIYGEYNATTGQIVVANYDGNSISIIDVSLDEYGNDGPNFGTTYTVPVGNHPASVTVLADGTRAYVANQSDSTVTIVNMSSHTVEKTLPVTGHPRTVVSTVNSLYGKVYVASPDSPYISIIRTDQDILSTTVLVQGNAVDVRITSPDTSSQNMNLMSRLPGAGQPCYLPPEAFTAASVGLSVANCKVQNASLLTQ
jgi:YVTN family beta-propeller protein